jgi:hypothetical protein
MVIFNKEELSKYINPDPVNELVKDVYDNLDKLDNVIVEPHVVVPSKIEKIYSETLNKVFDDSVDISYFKEPVEDKEPEVDYESLERNSMLSSKIDDLFKSLDLEDNKVDVKLDPVEKIYQDKVFSKIKELDNQDIKEFSLSDVTRDISDKYNSLLDEVL